MANPQIEDDAHHAESLGVELLRKDDGGSSLKFKFKSLDEELNCALEFELPQHWEHSIAQGSAFDPLTLPENETDKQQTLFRRNIANRRNDAWLQRLVFNEGSVARSFGQNSKELNIILKPQTMEEYVQNLNTMIVGTECIILRRAGDVWDILPQGMFGEDEEKFKSYRLAWLNKELSD